MEGIVRRRSNEWVEQPKGKGKKGKPFRMVGTLAEKKQLLKETGETVLMPESCKHFKNGTCRMSLALSLFVKWDVITVGRVNC